MNWKTWLLPNFRELYRAAREVYSDPFHAKIGFLFSIAMIGLPFFFYFSDEAVNAQASCTIQFGCPVDDTLSGFSLLTPIPILGYAWYKLRIEKPWRLKRMRKKLLQELSTRYE